MLIDPSPADPRATGIYTVETLLGFRSRFLRNARDVQIALPRPAEIRKVKRDSRQSQPLLLLNDGQDLEALGILETLTTLVAAGKIGAPMVVAIPANGDRMMEYGISGEPDSRGRGARAALYARFVLDEVMPVVTERALGEIRAADTAILGASLGGLSAFDLAWRNPHVFGICGVFSGSFWWRTDSSSMSARQASRIAHRLIRRTRPAHTARAALRFWFQTGTEDETDDRDGNGVIDAIQDTTELIGELRAKGWQPGDDAIYREVIGGRHEPSTWAGVFAEFARFAFASRAA